MTMLFWLGGALGLINRHTSPLSRPVGDSVFSVSFHHIEPKLSFLKIAYCNKALETKALAHAMG
jgi:hypothetical protein